MAPEVLKKNFIAGCGDCPMRACGSCPLKTAGSEGSNLGDSSPIKKVFRGPAFMRGSLIIFRPGGIEVFTPKSPEKKCSICGEKSGCSHETNLSYS